MAHAHAMGSPGSSQLSRGVHRVHLSTAFASGPNSADRSSPTSRPRSVLQGHDVARSGPHEAPMSQPRTSTPTAPRSLLDGVFNAAVVMSSGGSPGSTSCRTSRDLHPPSSKPIRGEDLTVAVDRDSDEDGEDQDALLMARLGLGGGAGGRSGEGGGQDHLRQQAGASFDRPTTGTRLSPSGGGGSAASALGFAGRDFLRASSTLRPASDGSIHSPVGGVNEPTSRHLTMAC